MPPVVSLEDVSFVRNGRPILQDVSWTIEPGQHWALLGANGSGKTTLLKILSGYAWATTGRVTVLGETFGQTNLPKLRKRIGWVSTALAERFPSNHTGRQIVASGFDATLGLYRQFSEEEWVRCLEVLHLLGAAGVAEQHFETMSQGEQARVRIARALANRPPLLILDEPCAGLDPVSRRHFLSDVQRFSASDDAPTVIFVTHHIEEIGPWLTHVIGLSEGRTVEAGPIAEVLSEPMLQSVFREACRLEQSESGYLATFRGAPTKNA